MCHKEAFTWKISRYFPRTHDHSRLAESQRERRKGKLTGWRARKRERSSYKGLCTVGAIAFLGPGPTDSSAVFDLPEELLYTLQLNIQPTTAPLTPPREPSSSPKSPSLDGTDRDEGAPSSATSCGLCGLNFSSLQTQRSHVRSDLHGYNLKQKMRGEEGRDGDRV